MNSRRPFLYLLLLPAAIVLALAGCGGEGQSSTFEADGGTPGASPETEQAPQPSSLGTFFDSGLAPLSGPDVIEGSASDAQRAGVLVAVDPSIVGTVERAAYNEQATKLLVRTAAQDDVLIVEAPIEAWRDRSQMEAFAKQFADAPSESHPTRVTVTTLARSRIAALVFDPVVDTGLHPEQPRTRSATFLAGERQITLVVAYKWAESDLLDLADSLAVQST
jgi:hypothetical protein